MIQLLAWVGQPISTVNESAAWVAAIWFTAAVALLGAFDISLPRGDALSVTGALDAVSLLVLGPAPAIVVTFLGTLVAYALRLRAVQTRRLGPALASRLVALGAAVAIVVPLGRLVGGESPWSWGIAAVGVATYLATELLALQLLATKGQRRSVSRSIRGNLDRQAPLLAAQFSSAMLAALVFPTIGAWSLVLVVAVLLLIRQSYAMLLEIRETFRTTVEVLVDAAEGHGTSQHGHAERTAQLAREIAADCSFPPSEVERVSYAALLHDLGRLNETQGETSGVGASASVIEGVTFFQDVLAVVKLCDGDRDVEAEYSENDRVQAFIVALSSDIDSISHGIESFGHPARLARLAQLISPQQKARVVAAAVKLGHGIPAL